MASQGLFSPGILLYIITVYCGPFACVCQETIPLRSLTYTVCNGKELTGSAIQVQEVASKIACGRECAGHGSCQAANFCRTNNVPTCVLFSGTVSSCSSLANDSGCSFIQMVNPCQNGGELNKTVMMCKCTTGWEGDLCQTPSTSSTSPTSSAVTTTTATTTTVTLGPNDCLSGAVCVGKFPSATNNGVKYCCQTGMTSIVALSINGVFSCSCS